MSADVLGAIGVDRYQEQAFEVIRRGITSASDLSREDPRLIDRYDTSRLFRKAD